ncbi:hypothetical protein [Streptomyces johnsoniae]|uniref:ABM domain-containing protein n=1 Tax=Streptomyces johnsoniae TaxID=3075532 RepID=A0ABU2RY39_9ACTN|nr:hypothetical protein [Streptomyces sp. DSM 41886]MDT0441408.1 hypothetical protein [Streptomyces sp. DSM 41886]
MMRIARDLSGPVVVINRFAVKQDARLFEQQFLEHIGSVGRRGNVDLMTTFRSVGQPGNYIHFGFWRTLGAFVETVHDEAILREVAEVGTLVDTRADQAECLGEVRGDAVSGRLSAACAVVSGYRVHGRVHDFEERLWRRADHLARHGGPSSVRVLRSFLSPRDYITLEWGEDSHLFDRVLRSSAYHEMTADIVEVADVEADVAQCIAEKGQPRDRLRHWCPRGVVPSR